MSLGSWDPGADNDQPKLNPDTIQSFVALSTANKLDHLADSLSTEEQQRHAALMHIDGEQWFSAAETLSDEDIEHLMRFFTKAEQLPGWQAGADSPVIWLGKVLKQRGSGISRELTLWIKANSDNRFLPHGALL